jgi:hypothetical protein
VNFTLRRYGLVLNSSSNGDTLDFLLTLRPCNTEASYCYGITLTLSILLHLFSTWYLYII